MSTPNSHSLHAIAAAAALAFCYSTLAPADAGAAFTKTELKCRSAVAKGGAKIATTAMKAVQGCHKKRDKDGSLSATDCNDIDQADAAKNKVAGLVTKLNASVGGSADRCVGLTTTELNYHRCPAPCDAEVPSIDDFSDVALCVTCLAKAHVEDMTGQALGSPSPPLNKADGKCHGSLSKNQSKLFSTVLKTRVKCQSGAEKKAGVETLASCINGADSKGDSKIAGLRSKGELGIAIACQPANRPGLDSCATTSLTGLQNCTLDAAQSAAEFVFTGLYRLGSAGPTTTVTTSTSTTSTSTSTTLAPATWTEVQGILATNCAGAACHTSGGISGGLSDLDDFDAGHANLVNAASTCSITSFATRVSPGDPANSFLMHKLDGTQDCGSRMPFGQAQLPAATRDAIRAWIQGGGLKN